MVEGGLKRLIFKEQALAGPKCPMNLFQAFFEASDSLAYVLRTRIVGAIRKPGRNIPGLQSVGNRDTVQNVADRRSANIWIGISDGPVYVFLILKGVRSDRSRTNREFLAQGFYFAYIFEAIRKIPLHVQGKSRTSASDGVHLRGIAKF